MTKASRLPPIGSNTNHQYFRANVGAMIINRQGKVLVLERADVKGAWQMPQGGIALDELPADAVLRELMEETSIPADKLEVLAEAPEWLAYELPEEYRSAKTGLGQVQKWFLFRYLGTDREIRPDQREFVATRWVDYESLMDMTVAFRRPLYKRLLQDFRQYLSGNGASTDVLPSGK